ncbi:MAG: peptide deformylase [Alphaproteobacteria bacterium]|nr:MAG: peptide deformylase [Alphaproteobacteria bacterium]
MAILPIYVAPHPVLKKIAEPVTEVTDDLRKLMDDMLETMYAAPGIGLAAPQVGVSKRILVLDVDQPKKDDEDADIPKAERRGKPQFFVNPEITWESEEKNIYDEGCLSLPGQYAEVERPKRVKVKFLGYDGKQQEIECDGLLATCIQHEMDHLNGILFVDHLSTLKRDIVMRKLRKWTRENAEDIAASHVL